MGGGFWTRPQKRGGARRNGHGRGGADSGKGPKIAGISIYLEDLESAGHGAENPFRRRFKGVSAGGRPGTRGLEKESRVRFSQASWPGPAGHSQDFGGIPGFPAPVAARGGGLFCGPPASKGGGLFCGRVQTPAPKAGDPRNPPLGNPGDVHGICGGSWTSTGSRNPPENRGEAWGLAGSRERPGKTAGIHRVPPSRNKVS